MNTDTAHPQINHGKNIKRLREILGVKQEVLALDLGISQQTISDLEQKEKIEETMLKKVATALKIPVEAIKNLDDNAVNNYINTFNDSSSQGGFNNYQCTFNPIDKIVELYTEKEKLYEEKEQLYERMIKEKEGVLDKLLELLNRKIE